MPRFCTSGSTSVSLVTGSNIIFLLSQRFFSKLYVYEDAHQFQGIFSEVCSYCSNFMMAQYELLSFQSHLVLLKVRVKTKSSLRDFLQNVFHLLEHYESFCSSTCLAIALSVVFLNSYVQHPYIMIYNFIKTYNFITEDIVERIAVLLENS